MAITSPWISLEDLQEAAQLVNAVMPATPQYAWPKLAQRIGASVWVKHENHTPTGAFKIRGGLVYLHRLRRSGAPVNAIISATRGNHGQSLALAASREGFGATIYVPFGNSPDQNSAMRAFDARVIEFGRDFDEAKHEAKRAAIADSLHMVPSFHRDLVTGVATYALEFFSAVRRLDTVYVSVGMGSGICGLITVRDLLGLKTEIVGVSAERAPANALSFAAGRPESTATARTFADGIATREPDPEAMRIILGGAARFVTVGEEEIAEAVRLYFDATHQVVEGAGAAPLAALISESARQAGRSVGLILSGGNIERSRFLEILNGGTPKAA